MGTAVNSLVTAIRATIPELSAIEWTNDRLIGYLNKEYHEWAADLGKLPGPGWFTMVVAFSVSANATTKDLTTLLTTEGTFAAIKSLWYLPESGDPVHIESASPGQEEHYRLSVGGEAYGQSAPWRRWLTRPAGVPTLNIGPVANVARNFEGLIRYRPPVLAAGLSVQTDPSHDDLLVLGAALRALLDTSETDPTIKKRYDELRVKFLEDERMAAGESDSETTKVVVSDEMFG